MNSKQTEKGVIETLWGLFVSVRLSVIVLTLLAVTSIIGTVIPQNGSPMAYMESYGEGIYRIFAFLDLFDMYHSWWFQLLLVLLGINLVVCSMDRLPAVMKIVKKKQVKNPKVYQSALAGESISMDRSPEEAAAFLEARLAGTMGSFDQVTQDETEARLLFSEKGRWTRLGVYVVHASVLLLLIGGLLGSLFGYEGFMNIPEGGSLNEVTLKNGHGTVPLDFQIRCDKFTLSHYDTGAPKEYRSDLVVLKGGDTLLEKSIVVNDPLRYQGISFYQASYGQATPKKAEFSFKSRASNMVYTRTGSFGEAIKIPEGLGTFTPMQFSGNYSFRGHAVGAAVLGLLEKEGKEPLRLVLPVRFSGFDRMRKGDVVISVSDFEERYYTGLQVTKDPGVWMVYAGFVLLIAGCWVTFFMSHKSFMVEVKKDRKGSLVTLYGNTNKNKLGMEMVIRRLTESLKKELGTPERQVK
ncbi:MAG: cytochrome c biogenesis protein ResB [Desulfobacterales bacterium]|nr:cytochrome c biogenesis protein ResB [Desulfobacterales bacterium]